MELTRNKIIIISIVGVLIFFMFILLIIMFITGNSNQKRGGTSSGDFVIWTVGDTGDSTKFLEGFKKFSGAKNQIILESFDNYEDYTLALTKTISSGTAPDIFVLNNNEKNSLFENQTIGISPNIVDATSFAKNYKTFIAEQLISKGENQQEFLVGLPVGYETLGIFYNKDFVNPSDLTSISAMNSSISKIKEKDSNIIPIAIGNGTTVDFSEDIITQFIISEGNDRSLSNLSRTSIQKGLANYLNFGDIDSENGYNSRFEEMKIAKQKSTDLFSYGDTAMIVGYPRLINDIDKKGFGKKLLFASVFPNDSSSKASLVNYNYFVINKDSTKINLAEKFISYLTTKNGLISYFESYPYYLPSMIELENEMLSQKIHPKYNIKLGDFYNDSYNYTSFDKGIKTIYDSEVKKIIDNEKFTIENFINFQKSLVCKTNKIINQTDFSKSCE